MNAQLADTKLRAPYLPARGIAEKDGVRLASHFNLDSYRMGGQPSVFWARELQVSGVLFARGRSIKDKSTQFMLRACDIKKAHEGSRNGIYGKAHRNNVLLLVDAKGFSAHKGFQVIEEPAIIVVENPVLQYGGWGKTDEATKIAVNVSDEEFKSLKIDEQRWNNLREGIWPLHRVANLLFGYYIPWRSVGGDILPSTPLGVLVEGKAKA